MRALTLVFGGMLALAGSRARAADGEATEGAATEQSGLILESGSPDALCPDLPSTREAVRRRLGTLVAPGGAGWRARYTIGHAPEGNPRDFVRLELFGPDGSLQLSRDLPLEAACATMADVIALVLDRHFRGLPHEQPEPVAAAAEPPPPPATQLERRPPDGPEPGKAAAPAAAAPAQLLFVAAELSAQHPVGPALGLRSMAELTPGLYLGAAASWAFDKQSERLGPSAQVEARGLTLQTYAAVGLRFDSVRCYIGPGVRVSLDRGSARGLPNAYSGQRAVLAFGGNAGLLWNVQPHLLLTLAASLDHPIQKLSGQFQIDQREVLEPEALRLGLALGLGYAFWL